MTFRLDHYFKTFRLRSALSQKELSFLIACKSESYIARIEQGKRTPSLEVVLAYMILFDAPPPEVVPAIWDELEAGIMARAEQLYYDLQGTPSRAIQAKLDSLEEILDRHDSTRL